MAAKPVSLAVHKNTVERRRKRELARDLVARTGKMARDNDLRAYAVVAIDSEGNALALWDTGAIMPMWAFADVIGNILRKDIANSEAEEDWRPALPVSGSRSFG